MKLDTLYKRDKTGKKILSYEIEIVEWGFNDDNVAKEAKITKTTGFINGKKQQHIDFIDQGKQNRTVWEQAISEAESAWRYQRDCGYKSLKDLNLIIVGPTEDAGEDYHKIYQDILVKKLLEFLPEDRTDASGVHKPMKCTATNDTKTGKLKPAVLKKIVYPADAQPKLDGVRCLATNYTDTGFRFTSSEGKSYDIVGRYIKGELDNMNLPVGIELDGEFYIHGTPLEKISGWCRTQRPIEEHEQLKFYIFDLPCKETWEIRKGKLEDMMPTEYNPKSKVRFVNSTTIESLEEAQEAHDRDVELGYEGEIIRNRKGKYAYGIRSAEIFKMKNFQDDEFEITGITLGKRGAFDMVFNVITKEGKPFKAKPLGDLKSKEDYCAREKELIGKKATVRYLNYSSYGIPVGNPVLKAIRDYE